MDNAKLSLLNKRELIELMYIAHNSLFWTNLVGLRNLFSELSNLMPFNSFCCAYGNLKKAATQENPEVDIIDISYPEDYINQYLSHGYHLTDPIIAKHLENYHPINWNKYIFPEDKSKKYTELVNAESYGMRDGWTYGTFYPDSGESSIFFMAGEDYDSSERTKTIIEYIIPFLSEAFKSLLEKKGKKLTDGEDKITLSEIEILNWIKEGKTSWEISVILNKSERVVNFHISNIIRKLNAMNRTHAVVIALKNHLINL